MGVESYLISCSVEAAQASGSSCWGVSPFWGVLSPLVSPDTVHAVMNSLRGVQENPLGCGTDTPVIVFKRRRLAWGGPKKRGDEALFTDAQRDNRHINNL